MRGWLFVGLTIVSATGCSTLLSIRDPSTGDAGTHGDGGDGRMDGRIDAAPVVGSPLLLSEVALAPTDGEMIEIVNTSNQAVDLSTFYLSDNGNYFRLPVGNPVVDPNDFIAQFPPGASIPGHGVVTVAMSTTAGFTTLYGIAPTFSIASGTMIEVASSGTVNLSNNGEMVVLFQWDGQSDLVRDADIILVGSPSLANSLIDKSGIMQDGIDADTVASAYQTDAMAITIQAGTPPSATSTKRIALEDGHETHDGTGNGLSGEDETSEDTSVTWDNVFSAPTPGQVPAALLQ